jgi:hypothetical protein
VRDDAGKRKIGRFNSIIDERKAYFIKKNYLNKNKLL